MNGLLLLIISVAVLVVGYIFYGRWLCRQPYFPSGSSFMEPYVQYPQPH